MHANNIDRAFNDPIATTILEMEGGNSLEKIPPLVWLMTRHLKGEHFTSFPNRTDELKNIIADYRRDYFNWEQFFIEEYDGEDFTEYLQDTCLYERKSF